MIEAAGSLFGSSKIVIATLVAGIAMTAGVTVDGDTIDGGLAALGIGADATSPGLEASAASEVGVALAADSPIVVDTGATTSARVDGTAGEVALDAAGTTAVDAGGTTSVRLAGTAGELNLAAGGTTVVAADGTTTIDAGGTTSVRVTATAGEIAVAAGAGTTQPVQAAAATEAQVTLAPEGRVRAVAAQVVETAQQPACGDASLSIGAVATSETDLAVCAGADGANAPLGLQAGVAAGAAE